MHLCELVRVRENPPIELCVNSVVTPQIQRGEHRFALLNAARADKQHWYGAAAQELPVEGALAGDQWLAISLFGFISFGAPAIFVLLIRTLF